MRRRIRRNSVRVENNLSCMLHINTATTTATNLKMKAVTMTTSIMFCERNSILPEFCLSLETGACTGMLHFVFICVCVCACVRARVYVRSHACMRAPVCVCVCMRAHVRACVRVCYSFFYTIKIICFLFCFLTFCVFQNTSSPLCFRFVLHAFTLHIYFWRPALFSHSSSRTHRTDLG